jgi:hypothetical protein
VFLIRARSNPQVKVRDATEGSAEMCFPCNAWLDATSGDKAVTRSLKPGVARPDVLYR